MNITKEWLQQTISELEQERDATPGVVNEDAVMALEAMRIALASLEAEAVAWRCGSTVTVNKPVADDWKRRGFAFHPLYAVLPAPVVPNGWVLVPVEPTEDMIVNGFESEPDESFSDEREWEEYDAVSGCQQAAHRAKLCWAAMIAVAPKLKHDLT
ncbi:hypothetical protein [Huaxiibacter chinensis]